jgi:hypothetical protein
MVRSGGQARGNPYRNSTPKKKTKLYSDAEDNLDDDYQDVSVDDSFHNNDPAVPTPVVPMALSQPMNTAICAQDCSPPPGRHTSLVVSPTLNSIQLYETAEVDVNILGLTALIGNTKRVLDNARGYLNWLRITIPLTSPSDYEKTELTLVPGHPSFLQLTYPAIPTAITKDFKLVEVQMEVEFYDSSKNNNGYISNVQDRTVGRESMLAKMENATKRKLLVLPIDPTTGKPYTCNNYHWQGSTHTNTKIGELYLRSYKNAIPIMPNEIKEGGGFDAGVLPTNFGSRYYKRWMIPVPDQDSDKLAEKFVKKGPMKFQTKADRALEMMQKMKGRRVIHLTRGTFHLPT